MILTVTLNPTFDKALIVDSLRPGQLHRVEVGPVVPSGKGINVARVLASWGVPVNALVLAGEGRRRLSDFLDSCAIPCHIIPVAGEIRTNIKLFERLHNQMTELNEPGPTVSQMELDHFENVLLEMAGKGDMVVFSGSLPPGAPINYYAKLIAGVSNKGALPVVDTAGLALSEAVQLPLYAAKPNRAEALELLGYVHNGSEITLTDEQLLMQLHRLNIKHVLLTLGADGAMFVAAGKGIRTVPPKVSVGNPAGAGDSLLATYLAGIYLRWPLQQNAVRATAAGAVAACGLGTDLATPDAILAIEDQVKVYPVEIQEG